MDYIDVANIFLAATAAIFACLVLSYFVDFIIDSIQSHCRLKRQRARTARLFKRIRKLNPVDRSSV